jgi:4-hydroxybenzoate polyprenyltransferase
LLTSSGVSTGFYSINVIAKNQAYAIFILIAASGNLYATSLKQMMLVGISLSLLLAFSVIIIGIFDLFPATTTE